MVMRQVWDQARVSACSLSLPQWAPWPTRAGQWQSWTPTPYGLVGAGLWALGGLKQGLSHGKEVGASGGQSGPERPLGVLRVLTVNLLPDKGQSESGLRENILGKQIWFRARNELVAHVLIPPLISRLCLFFSEAQ